MTYVPLGGGCALAAVVFELLAKEGGNGVLGRGRQLGVRSGRANCHEEL